jgi:hypothetical protein
MLSVFLLHYPSLLPVNGIFPLVGGRVTFVDFVEMMGQNLDVGRDSRHDRSSGDPSL